MKLPELLYGNNKIRREAVAFGGVNYSENHAEGQWEETENLGSGRWPALSPRAGRSVARECQAAPTALYAWEELASVEGTGFYYGGEYIGEVSAGPKQMVRVGDQIVIWPDKRYYNWKTGAFTALEVGFTLEMGLSSAVGEDYVAIPPEQKDFQPTETEPVTYTGGWLGVDPGARAGQQKYRFTSYRQRIDGIEVQYNSSREYAIDQAKVGQMILLDYSENVNLSTAAWGKILEVHTAEREYMPGVMRKCTEILYERYNYSSTYELWRPSATRTMYGWAYGASSAITQAGTDANLGYSFYRREYSRLENVMGWDEIYPQEQYDLKYSPGLNGTPVGAENSKNMVEVGDILSYSSSTGKARMLTAIDRAYYLDHYYTSSYTVQEVQLVTSGANVDPETAAAALDIGIGDRVRVSRGGVSVDTKILSFDAEYLYKDNAPGMQSATLGIQFADSIRELLGQSGPISIDRIAEPDLSYICVHDNRLWGVHEGRIWCSKFGDPQNFDADTGTDADAWWTEVGSPGDWTGIVSYSGSVLAFKENLVHKVVGDLPSEFTVSTYNIAGIQPGSHQSAAIVNEVLYYKGTNGVYAYSGYTPSFLSMNFGERKFAGAVGGTDGARYYLSMQDEAGAWQLYCYDTIRGVWLREDGLHANAFSLYDGKLYCAAEEQGAILTFGEAVEEGIPWSAVSVPFYEGSFDRKQVTKLLIRAELPAGSTIRVAVSYDGGAWQELYNTRAPRWRVAILPVRPKRCDSFRIRVEGEGDVTLRGIAREVLTGSER